MRHPLRAVAALAAAATLLTGCGSGDDWSEPHAAPVPAGTLGPGFLASSATPAPESTITPAPGSWSGVHPPEGYRVVLLATGDDAPTRALVSAVTSWATTEKADLRTITADATDPIPDIAEAVRLAPDLIVSAGETLIDPLAVVTANHLDQQFLVVGAELAEPTGNVTAADWAGASFRGEGLGSATTYDPASFTAARCGDAVRAGVAAVLHDVTGVIVWLS
ncbi:hypothetical protein [Actinoplanes awajinensis]|uniref:BMP family ABC transporter substrate-binding protein n=1 Tax=Actinoplanes awajinensis subsp. mycoplanecinus TaxID=135947 RepID=A0A101JT98_9ACTN|nr:hypothetical protein [Actinoplanes awajinensis]KUL32611.1 hypothetical protein ADL15_19000 [Actinoplanes awajinensis subsp. mycoplanecinus]